MSSTSRDALLKLALPLVKNHGFTRSALSLAAMHSPSGKHTAPLNDTAVDALFGEGDEARRTLINAWLDDARASLRTAYSQGGIAASTMQTPSLGNVLKTRLSRNEEVLEHLPEVSTRVDSEALPVFIRQSHPLRHLLSSPRPQYYPHSSFL
jgi:ubiquinone biosynthesis protein COQ9